MKSQQIKKKVNNFSLPVLVGQDKRKCEQSRQEKTGKKWEKRDFYPFLAGRNLERTEEQACCFLFLRLVKASFKGQVSNFSLFFNYDSFFQLKLDLICNSIS